MAGKFPLVFAVAESPKGVKRMTRRFATELPSREEYGYFMSNGPIHSESF
jgi:hypothetical protein